MKGVGTWQTQLVQDVMGRSVSCELDREGFEDNVCEDGRSIAR